MRIAGYVREAAGRQPGDTAFAQSERIRRWALDSGNDLIATCQDLSGASAPEDRPGYRALVEIVRTGKADAVVIAALEALSPDKVLQEIMLVDLRAAGATVISTNEEDLAVMTSAKDDHARLVVRDVVAKVSEYRAAFGLTGEPGGSVDPAFPDSAPNTEDTRNVVVEFIAPTG